VTGAPSANVARAVAFAIGNSPLVKTAMHGEDPNWGRIVSAAGYASTKVVESKMTLKINGAILFKQGIPAAPAQKKRCARSLNKKDILIELALGLGTARAKVWTCDLTRDYIAINADYHT